MQHDDVEDVATSRILPQVFKEVMPIDLVEERGAILEFVDVHLFHCSTDELIAAVLSCLSNFLVFGASLVNGFGLLHFHYCCIFGDLVIPEAKAFGDEKCNASLVGHVGRLCLHNPYNMMKPISPVVGDGLQDAKELFLQGEKFVIMWLADDGRLGVQSIMEKLCDIHW